MFGAEIFEASKGFFTIQTPALIFPTVSLLLLAYTNRFLAITSVIRTLHKDMCEDEENHDFYFAQLNSLTERIKLIIWAQKTGTISILSCVLSMIFMFVEGHASLVLFGVALFFMSASLILIFKELSISKEALNYILEDCAKIERERKSKN
jgi:hypothetical protein